MIGDIGTQVAPSVGLTGNQTEERGVGGGRRGNDVQARQGTSGPNDVVEVRENSRQNPAILGARDTTAHAPTPNWMEVDKENLRARVLAQPKREELVQIQINEQLIVELYSK